MLKELLILILVISPAFAASNMTEAQVLHGMELARGAGMMDAGAMFAKSEVAAGHIQVADYWTFIKTANEVIRDYNRFVMDNFNVSVQDRLKMAEYSL